MSETHVTNGDDTAQKGTDSVACQASACTGGRYFSTGVTVVFLVIMALGLGVRLAHLTAESVWWDEFATVAFLDVPDAYKQSPHYERWNQQVIRQSSPTYKEFLAQNRLVDPAAMPLYLSMEYFWNKHVHRSVVSLRLMSLIISMSVLPLLFLLGRKLFNPKAGLIAMFCVALSPIHVQFAKEIRMYGLMTLLAVALVLLFLQLLQSGKWRWWVSYGVVALLLSWTHPFALLLPVTLGIFWLTAYPKDIRRIIAWSALNACVLLPAVVYVLTIQFWGEDTTGGWMRLPTLSELATDILADDAIGMTYQVNATPTAFTQVFGEQTAREILRWRWTVGRIMIGGVLAAMAGLIVMTFRQGRNQKREEASVFARYASFKYTYLLLLWLVIPPVALYALSVFWRPCIMPRYTVHCSLALYLIAGGAVSLISVRFLRRTAMFLLLVFYGYQQMLMIGEPQHPDWRGAVAFLKNHAAPTDLILTHNWLWKRVFAFNLGPTPFVVSYGSSHDILAEQCAFFLSNTLESDAAEPTAWVVVRTEYFEQGPIYELERELVMRGLRFDATEFGGIQHVLVYRVHVESDMPPGFHPDRQFKGEAPKEFGDLSLEYWRDAQYEMAVLFADYANRIDPEYARAWSYKGMALKELERKEESLDAFQRAVAIDRLDYPWSHVNIAMLLVDLGRYAEAVNAAMRALDILPDDPWTLAQLGRAHLGLGEYDASLEALRRAASLNAGDVRIRQMLEEAEAAAAAMRGAHE